MVNQKQFTITTAIPYVNADPHIGFALELVQADALARYHRLCGKGVFFLTGTDENSLKNVQAAEAEGMLIKELVNINAERYRELTKMLNISNDDFIRTTEERHIQGAKKLWESCRKDDIYKKKYKGLYCVGCETFYTEKDLENGVCPEHQTKPEIVEEENYFFRLSRYQNDIEDYIRSDRLRIIPESRKNEILEFIRGGLEDFSISRSRERAKAWGIPVPGDDSQIMYVWFDALSNYINAVGYANNPASFKTRWEESARIIHVIGKGITRFHAVYWPAMLLSAGIRLPDEIFIHGYVTIGGKKISKSLGNVIDPFAAVQKYGKDAVRYFLLREIPSHSDGDFTFDRLEAKYTGDLVHGIGNYASRVLAMIEKYFAGRVPAPLNRFREDIQTEGGWKGIIEAYAQDFESCRFDKASSRIDHVVRLWGDAKINKDKPWALEKINREALADTLYHRAELLRQVGLLLSPFLPDASQELHSRLGIEKVSHDFEHEAKWGGLEPGIKVVKGDALFPKL